MRPKGAALPYLFYRDLGGSLNRQQLLETPEKMRGEG